MTNAQEAAYLRSIAHLSAAEQARRIARHGVAIAREADIKCRSGLTKDGCDVGALSLAVSTN